MLENGSAQLAIRYSPFAAYHSIFATYEIATKSCGLRSFTDYLAALLIYHLTMSTSVNPTIFVGVNYIPDDLITDTLRECLNLQWTTESSQLGHYGVLSVLRTSKTLSSLANRTIATGRTTQ